MKKLLILSLIVCITLHGMENPKYDPFCCLCCPCIYYTHLNRAKLKKEATEIHTEKHTERIERTIHQSDFSQLVRILETFQPVANLAKEIYEKKPTGKILETWDSDDEDGKRMEEKSLIQMFHELLNKKSRKK